MIFQNRLFCRELSTARLVAVASPADVVAARTGAPSTAAAELAPCAAAATVTATTAVTAGSPATSAAVILLSSATKLAVSGVAASHSPVRAAARCAASVAAGPSVASIVGVAAAAVAPATPTVCAAHAAEPVTLALFAGRSRCLFVSVARAPRLLPAARGRRLVSAGSRNLFDQIQGHLGIDMAVGMNRVIRPPSPHGLYLPKFLINTSRATSANFLYGNFLYGLIVQFKKKHNTF